MKTALQQSSAAQELIHRGRNLHMWCLWQGSDRLSETLESARPVARRVTKAVGRGDWAQVFEPRRRYAGLPRLIGAAAVGGALMYFFDPVQGSERRRSASVASRLAVARVVEAAKTARGRVGGPSADSENHINSLG